MALDIVDYTNGPVMGTLTNIMRELEYREGLLNPFELRDLFAPYLDATLAPTNVAGRVPGSLPLFFEYAQAALDCMYAICMALVNNEGIMGRAELDRLLEPYHTAFDAWIKSD